MIAPVLTTPRLTLRPYLASDLDDLVQTWTDPAVHQLILGRAPTREELWTRLLKSIGQWQAVGWGSWVMRERATDRFIGEIGYLHNRRDTEPNFEEIPEMGWAVAAWAQHQGFAREALTAAIAWGDANGLLHTVCITDPRNGRSIALAQEFGFRFVVQGSYHDEPINLYERHQDS